MGDVPRIFTGRHLPSTPKQDKSVDGDDDNGEKRVTIWNWKEKRKLSGNSAPFKRNLQKYLKKHPDWHEYIGQDKDTTSSGRRPTPKKRKNLSTPTATPTKAATKAPTSVPTKAEFVQEDVETCEPVPLCV